jgi:hypothetical protein
MDASNGHSQHRDSGSFFRRLDWLELKNRTFESWTSQKYEQKKGKKRKFGQARW